MYSVSILPSALRDLGSLPRSVQERIRDKIDALALSPRPVGAKALKGSEGRMRLRVGDYRVIYRIDDAERFVLISRIGHRREIYRRA